MVGTQKENTNVVPSLSKSDLYNLKLIYNTKQQQKCNSLNKKIATVLCNMYGAQVGLLIW